MLRRALCVLLLLATGAPALASVEGTAHDTEMGDGTSLCSACHIPHQAAGEKFWAQELVLDGKVGTISAMCASCHHSGEGYGALMVRAHSDDFVYAPTSHGQLMYLDDPPAATDVATAGLPDIQVEHGHFECSTCHSVHDDTYRPFLRDDINALCARCHRYRHYVNGLEKAGTGAEAGDWGIPGFLGFKNPGSHPVGSDAVEDRPDGPVIGIPSLFRLPQSPEPGKWSLGGHLTGGEDGGVTCTTCHSVHGTQPDPDDPAAATVDPEPPSPGFLTLAQATMTLPGSARQIPNGDGDYNRLCEACHGANNNPEMGPDRASWDSSGHNVSPGNSGLASHPVDSFPSSVNAGVTSFPETWPSGAEAYSGEHVDPVPICESCHTPHPAAAEQSGRVDVLTNAGSFILRGPLSLADGEPLCDRCHTEPVPGHHPIDKAYDSRGVPYLGNTYAGQGDILTCATCHETAHDWREPGQPALAPEWLPYDNGRAGDQADDMYDPDMSKTCMDCHYAMDGDGASLSPTLGSAQTVIAASSSEAEHYQQPDRSMGTHYIGLIHEDREWILEPIIDMFDTQATWRAQASGSRLAAGLADGWARFGGEDRDGNRVLVCESCHELEPDKNGGFSHLLLAPYEEGRNGLDEFPGDDDGHDILCEACHGVTVGVHPMTDMNISLPIRPLDTNSRSVREEIVGDVTMDRVRNALSCDSCHQPHDANTASFTYCLDAPPHLDVPGWTGPPVTAEGPYPSRPSEAVFGTTEYPLFDGREGTYTTPRDMIGDVSGFCQQCHIK